MDITMSTVVQRTTLLCNKTESTFVVGTDVPINSAIHYTHKACDGGFIASYNDSSSCLYEYNYAAGTTVASTDVGGGFIVTSECHSIRAGSTVTVYCEWDTTVAAIVNEADSLQELVDTLANTDLDAEDTQQVINLYFEHCKTTSGEAAVGINSIEQTVTSTENGGVNIITVTLTDDTVEEFEIRNGTSAKYEEMTLEVYKERVQNGTIDEDCYYIIVEDEE